MRTILLAAAVQIALAGAAFAQDTPEEEVVVTAQRSTEEAARGFVHAITAAPSPFGQAPIWHSPVCPGLIGLRAPLARTLLGRLGDNIRTLGIGASAPGCEPNVLIVFTDDANAVVAEADRDRLRYMGVDKNHGVSMGAGAWRDFLETPRPVRWWHVSRLMTRDNMPADRATVYLYDAGYIHQPTHLNLHHVFIVVDAARVNGIPVTALADYLTMAALAQIDPNADLAGTPSILNLFAEQNSGAPAALTEWDLAYLRGLYAAIPEASHPSQQERDIAHRMTNTLP